jgi:hypothetical protein
MDEGGLHSLPVCSVAVATVTACLACPNLAHRGVRIDHTSQTGTALPAWGHLWKCLAGICFGCMAQGLMAGGGCITRAIWHRDVRVQSVREL